jgi:hypothetical protein
MILEINIPAVYGTDGEPLHRPLQSVNVIPSMLFTCETHVYLWSREFYCPPNPLILLAMYYQGSRTFLTRIHLIAYSLFSHYLYGLATVKNE